MKTCLMMKKIFNLYNFTIIKILIINFFTFGKKKNINFIYKNIKNLFSQIFQDLFVIYFSNIKKDGSFIEIGVGNGKDLSNTYLLEKNMVGGVYCVNLMREILKY